MYNVLKFLLLLNSLVAVVSAAEVLISPDTADINLYGRFDIHNDGNPIRFNWPGSIIEAAFTGSTIGVDLDDGGGSYFNVELDGTVIDTLTPSSVTRRIISTDLDETIPHTIRLILRTNGKNCSFNGFYLANGNHLSKKPEKPIRKIEFIGDSWTAGDVVGTTTTNDLKYFNASLTYARLTSKALHAQDMLIARGGCGLVNGYGAVMQERYPQTLCDSDNNWNFSNWAPDIVVIFLGINDFNKGTADNLFITAYKRLLTSVRENYSTVPVVLIGLDETIQGHHHLNNVRKVAEGFTDVTVFSSPIRLTSARALWQHPTPAQHKVISDSLIPVISDITGWDTVPPVITATSTSTTVRPRHNLNHPKKLIKSSFGTIVFPLHYKGFGKIIEVYDSSGRMRYSGTVSEEQHFFCKDAGLPDGIYFVAIKKLF